MPSTVSRPSPRPPAAGPRKPSNRPAEATQDVNTGPAPTNRMVIRLLEEIRRDVAAVREDLRRLEAMQQAQTAVHPSPPRD